MEAPNPAPIPPEALVAHAGFVRRVAHAILRNDADADDAAQETLARGLATGPREPRALRAWLAAVARNVARTLRRRDTRATARARHATAGANSPAAADLVAREETLRAVVDAVAALDPADREVVLLRHYEGMPPRAIAARLGAPVETVKKRLVRAHARLRTRLTGVEGREGARRRRALAAFAGIAVAPVADARGVGAGCLTPAAVEGPLMVISGKTIALAATAALLVGGGVWAIASSRAGGGGTSSGTPNPVALAARALPPSPASPAPLAAGGHVARPATVAALAPTEGAALPPGWSRATYGSLSMALPDAWSRDKGHDPEMQTWSAPGHDDRPAAAFGVVSGGAAATLRARMPAGATARSVVVLGKAATWTQATQDGRVAALVAIDDPDPTTPGVAFVAMAPITLWDAHALDVEEVLRLLAPAPAPMEPAPPGEGQPDDLTLSTWGGAVPGDRVEGRVVRGRQGIAGATVHLLRGENVGPDGVAPPPRAVRETTTGADGVFAWAGVEPGLWAVVVRVPGRAERRAAVETRRPPATTPRVVVVFGTATIEGRGFLRDGTPAVGHTVRLFEERAHGTPTWTTCALDAEGRFAAAGLTAGFWVLSLQLGDDAGGDRRELAVETDAGRTTAVALGSDVAEPVWRGSARLASGTPCCGAFTRLALASTERTAAPTSLDVVADDRGAFAQRVPAGRYHVTLAGVPAVSMYAFDVEIGPDGLVRDVVVPGVLVAGTLVDAATGRPFPPVPRGRGASACIRRVDEPAVVDAVGIPVDDAGAFRMLGVPPGRYVVYARPPAGDDREGSSIDVAVSAATDVTGIALEVRSR